MASCIDAWWKNGWKSGYMDCWVEEKVDAFMAGQMNDWKVVKAKDGKVDGWTKERTEGGNRWIDLKVDGWAAH